MSELPRVTDILKEAGIIDAGWYTEEARDRGTAIHMACHYDDLGDLDQESLDSSLMPYLTAWRQFRRDHMCVWDHIEERRIQSTYRYTGKPDRDGKVDGHLAIVDIKSGAKARWHPIQLAAYAAMFFDQFRYNRIVVRLSDDGTYDLDNYGPTNPVDLTLFLSALTIHNWRRNGNGSR